jgi:quercetin dioxygenase-like cupin family protein
MSRLAYILDFKLLQEIKSRSAPPDQPNQSGLLDRRGAAGSVGRTGTRMGIMAALEKGITQNGTGYSGKTWNILGQVYFPKAVTDSTFAFETNSDPGQFVPVHIHPTQDEFILVQDGMLDLKLDGVWVQAKAGDLVRLPRGIPHGYFNKSDKPARALFWVSPTQKLEALFNQLHNLTDVAEIVRISAEHEVNFLPPEAND